MPRPPLASLEIATVVARHDSFSAAATELGLTHGAISRKIASLEAWLGILLRVHHETVHGGRRSGRAERA